jgi:hypothetical protein
MNFHIGDRVAMTGKLVRRGGHVALDRSKNDGRIGTVAEPQGPMPRGLVWVAWDDGWSGAYKPEGLRVHT